MYRDLRDQAKVFNGSVATAPASVGIAHDRTSEVGDAEVLSGTYSSVLGVQPSLAASSHSPTTLRPGPVRSPC